MSASEVLREARSLLFECGWIQRDYYSDKGLCSIGALSRVERGEQSYDGAVGWLESVIGDWSIAEWNDADGRTFNEVADAFERAAKLAEQDEATS